MPPRTRKVPQDHKPKQPRSRAKAIAAEAGEQPYTFTHDGASYQLPPARQYAEGVTGGTFMDALLDGGDESEIKLALTMLRSAQPDIDPAAWAAVRAKPMKEFAQLVGDWMQASGVNVGESPRSSA